MNLPVLILFLQILLLVIVARKKSFKMATAIYLAWATVVIAIAFFAPQIGDPVEFAKAEGLGFVVFLLLSADFLALSKR